MNIDLSNFKYDVTDDKGKVVGKVNKIFPVEDGINVEMYLFEENVIKDIVIGKHNNFSVGCGYKIDKVFE